jgi:hypothetical protein
VNGCEWHNRSDCARHNNVLYIDMRTDEQCSLGQWKSKYYTQVALVEIHHHTGSVPVQYCNIDRLIDLITCIILSFEIAKFVHRSVQGWKAIERLKALGVQMVLDSLA